MFSKNRRSVSACVLLLAAAGGVMSVSAGPLDPPAGPIGSTYKTLTEVEPRIAINAANTPGDADSRFRITQRGSYYLTANVIGAAGLAGIEIAVGGVTIDLNGFEMQGAAGSLDAIRMSAAGTTSVVVKNGTIRLWSEDGVDLDTNTPQSVRVENVHVSSCGQRGIAVGLGIVESCISFNNGGQGLVMGVGQVIDSRATDNTLSGILLTGSGSSVIGCTASGNGTHGIASTGAAVLISQCTASENEGDGIQASIASNVRETPAL